jgi:hypothetical protein
VVLELCKEEPGERPGQSVSVEGQPRAGLRVERPVPAVEGPLLVERLVLRAHKPPSSNKWDCSNSRSERFRPNSLRCRPRSR